MSGDAGFDLSLFAMLSIAIAGAVKSAPLIWTTLAGAFSERSGIINIGLEGMMLLGAFSAVWGSWIWGTPWAGLAMAAGVGALAGLFHGVVCIFGKADQIISGMGLNVIAFGLTGLLLTLIFNAMGNSPEVEKIPVMQLVGGVSFSVMHVMAALAGIAALLVFYQTRFGLQLRACGERPDAARAAGVNVSLCRLAAVVCSGILASLGGAHLSIVDVSYFSVGMSGGRGFIALAILICSGWRPGLAILLCLAFGTIEAGAERMQSVFSNAPSRLMLAAPFIVALVVLALRTRSVHPPEALGRH